MASDELTSPADARSLSRPDSASRPRHIALPPQQQQQLVSSSPDVSPLYYTAPTSPYFTPPTSPQPPPLPRSPPPDTDDSLPQSSDFPLDLALDDAALSTLDKIYLHARSKASFHRIYITHALPDLLNQVSPNDAIDYVLPLLNGLALDEDEQVKETLAAQLVPLMWWFFTHCNIASEDQESPQATVSVQTFTPILGTLLLSPNPLVGSATRRAIVDLLLRLKDADDSEPPVAADDPQAQPIFDRTEREMLRTELLQQVVIGMSRLDLDLEDQSPLEEVVATQRSESRLFDRQEAGFPFPRADTRSKSDNPYFPPLPIHPPASPPPPSNESRSRQSSGPLPSPPPEPIRHSPLRPISIPLSSAEESDWRHTESGNHSYTTDEVEEDEQAAVGRLSSMSLMAAVTASGTLGEEVMEEFVKEVVRVGQDSVYWVRREASFALGALAKVVPEEVVICSLLPLFNTLRRDSVWHVRHSALFALPAILARLSAKQRHSLALETILPLATDSSSVVQCGVLETLGEVLYTFHEDEKGPPAELVELFLGRRVQNGQKLLRNIVDRPLICAFNYPAVALTLGRHRWGELRATYLELAQNRSVKVRRTLAASVGEMAKILGTEHAQRDLVGVWWDGIRCEEEEVRILAVQSLPQLLGVVGTEVGDSLVLGLETVWDENGFRGWREREGIALGLTALGASTGPKGRRLVVGLVRRALEDSVAAVREAGVRVVAGLWPLLDVDALEQLRAAIGNLSQSPVFKRRMTFIACQHALAAVVPVDNGFFTPLLPLADDPIDAVRIRLARLVASISAVPPPLLLLQLTLRLSRDKLSDVRAYVCHPDSHLPLESYSTFSRPPPTHHPSNDPALQVFVSTSSASLSHSDQNSMPADTDMSGDAPNSGQPIFSAISHTEIDGNASASVVPVPA